MNIPLYDFDIDPIVELHDYGRSKGYDDERIAKDVEMYLAGPGRLYRVASHLAQEARLEAADRPKPTLVWSAPEELN